MRAEDTDKPSLTFKTAMRDIGRTLKLAWKLEPAQVGIYSFAAILEISGTLVSTYAAARLISLLFTAINHPSQRTAVWLWLAASIAGTLAISIGLWLMSYSKRILYLLTSNWSSLTFMHQLSNVDIQTFYDTDSRNTINKLDNGHGWQMSAACNDSLDLVYSVARLIAIVGVVASLVWWIAPFLILFMVPTIIAETRKAKAGWFVWDEKGDERHIYWGIAYQVARARHQFEIRALQAKKNLMATVETMLNRFSTKQRTILRKANWSIGLSNVFGTMGVAFAEIWLIIRILYRHNLSLSSYIFYSGVIARVSGALATVGGSYTYMQEALLYAHDFYEFMRIEPTIKSPANAIKLQPSTIPEIVFKDVWFRYPKTDKWVLEGLSFSIMPGEHLALIGENGAGKTTIIKLLLRFYDVDKGSIEIDGHDIKTLSLSSWYKQLGTLFQQFNEYPLDVLHNVIISKNNELDKKQLDTALKDSGLAEMVDKLPYGLETVLDSSFEKGVEPSGGQWQRVALARAFYRNANVLILDEPTAAIDARAEYEIFNKIFKKQSSKSAIIISHRFSTVRRADRIIVLDDGRIVEEGTHNDLMKYHQGMYRDMFEKQAEGYR